ncbi:prolactin-3C1-like isoform X2 [Peromyscus leucopus]|uniref:prolactin-3C1-like isoform X2 n=1 Tax=Peromyscus leucopus TaxID=10041 RepID=UPI001884F038|nr:prolactin-3C1-like isoform X2 [Peromyscus leucopus]
MQLSLTQPCCWMSLLLLISSLLPWEHVISTPDDQMFNEELYNKLISISHRTHIVARKMYKNLDVKLSKGRWFKNSGNNTCRTASIPTTKKTEVLLKVVINVSNAWKYPLKLLTPAVLTHLGSYDGMLARAVEVKYGCEAILEGAKVLLSRVQPGIEENNYPDWPELKQLRSSNKDTHLSAFHTLFYCLYKDIQKVNRYLKILRRRVIKKQQMLSIKP